MTARNVLMVEVVPEKPQITPSTYGKLTTVL
jgi:hypothetical protein